MSGRDGTSQRGGPGPRALRAALLTAALGALLAAFPAAARLAPAPRPAGAPARPEPGRPGPRQLATREEFRQFHNEMERAGYRGAVLAAVPLRYRFAEGKVSPVGLRFASFSGDLDGDGAPEWVVGYYLPVPSRPEGARPTASLDPMDLSGMARDDRARVAVFRLEGARWRLQWVSPGLGHEFAIPRFNLAEVEDGLAPFEHLRLPISLVDIDRDGRLEIAYYCWSATDSVGALPGILRRSGSRWVNVAPQADRFSLRDVDGDGRLEVLTASRYIGYGMGDDDVPRVWRWDGRQYQEASSEFPRFYAELVRRYQECVKRMEQQGVRFDRSVWERAIQKAASLAG